MASRAARKQYQGVIIVQRGSLRKAPFSGQPSRLRAVQHLPERVHLIWRPAQSQAITMRTNRAAEQSQTWVTRWRQSSYRIFIGALLQVSDDINEMVEQIQAIQIDISELAGRPISLVGGSKGWKLQRLSWSCWNTDWKNQKGQLCVRVKPKWKLW